MWALSPTHFGVIASGGERSRPLGPVGIEALEHGRKVAARKAPVERTRRDVVALLESAEPVRQGGQVG